MLKKKKIDSNFVEGLRVTDEETVKVVEEVLANDINKKIVEDIISSGGKAMGFAGNQNNLITAKKLEIAVKDSDSNIEKILDLGFVGEPISINSSFINDHIVKGIIPVIAPLGRDEKGNTYNINADTAAGAIAGALRASKLILLTDITGILDENKKLISSLNYEEAKKIISKNFILGGMKPKITTCIKAISQGVKQATILDGRIPHALILELFTEHGIGTQIYT